METPNLNANKELASKVHELVGTFGHEAVTRTLRINSIDGVNDSVSYETGIGAPLTRPGGEPEYIPISI